jgi:hypothetical protein
VNAAIAVQRHSGRRFANWSQDMTKPFTVAILAATIITGPALAQSPRANNTTAHPYRQSFEAGDYKYCLKVEGSPGCMYNSWGQCEEDRLGRGGFCYSK